MIDTAEHLGAGQELQADLCIVGAGAAGITIALQFVDAGISVLVLDSGGRRPDSTSQALCNGEVVNARLHPQANTYRRRGLGGSTTIWGGRCMPLDPQDFAPRAWLGLACGWPITYAAMLPYWRRAHAICELGAYDYCAATAIVGGMQPMFSGFAHGAVTTEGIERFSCPTDFGHTYAPALARSASVRVLLRASCTDIVLAPYLGAVRHIEVATSGGATFRVRAKAFVLAGGGLEVPRMLLASRRQLPRGIGNEFGQVGRHYMCHLAGTVGAFVPAAGRVPWHGYQRTAEGVYCRRRLSLSAEAQRQHRIGNAIARLHHPRLAEGAHRTGALSAIYLCRCMLPFEYAVRLSDKGGAEEGGSSLWPHVRNVTLDPFSTGRFAWQMIRHRVLAGRKFPSLIVAPRQGPFTMDVHAEQMPNPASRVTLARQCDRFGMPVPRIDWRYLEQDIRTVKVTLALVADALAAGGHGRLTFDQDKVEADMLREGAYGGHHLGTARMAESARNGVVDADCRVFGTRNLFVAGGAVFPTSGQANPTLTIVALALRLADHLAARLVPSGAASAFEPASIPWLAEPTRLRARA